MTTYTLSSVISFEGTVPGSTQDPNILFTWPSTFTGSQSDAETVAQNILSASDQLAALQTQVTDLQAQLAAAQQKLTDLIAAVQAANSTEDTSLTAAIAAAQA